MMQRGCPERRCVRAIGVLGYLTFFDVPFIAAAISLPAIEKKKAFARRIFSCGIGICVCALRVSCTLNSPLHEGMRSLA